MTLTGKTRLRHETLKGWFSRTPCLVLQVEYTSRTDPDPQFMDSREFTAWKDATVEDISALFVKNLI